MRIHWLPLFGVALSVCVLAGCKTGGSSSATAEPEKQEPEKPKIPVPPESKFAKIKTGMYEGEVTAAIGQPNNRGSYITGKAWIPFHFSGSDTHRTVFYYKGDGTLTFANDSAYTSGMSVISIDYDPTEPGYERSEPAK